MTQHGETVPVCLTAWWEPTTQSYKQMKVMNQPANRQVKRDGSEAAGEQQQRSWAAEEPPHPPTPPNRQLNLTFTTFVFLCQLSPGLRLQRSLSPP